MQKVKGEEPEWVGVRVKIEELPSFRARWGLVTVGSRWPLDLPCPVFEFAPVSAAQGQAG